MRGRGWEGNERKGEEMRRDCEKLKCVKEIGTTKHGHYILRDCWNEKMR